MAELTLDGLRSELIGLRVQRSYGTGAAVGRIKYVDQMTNSAPEWVAYVEDEYHQDPTGYRHPFGPGYGVHVLAGSAGALRYKVLQMTRLDPVAAEPRDPRLAAALLALWESEPDTLVDMFTQKLHRMGHGTAGHAQVAKAVESWREGKRDGNIYLPQVVRWMEGAPA